MTAPAGKKGLRLLLFQIIAAVAQLVVEKQSGLQLDGLHGVARRL
ncbi:hypothetical protein [Mesorhizobium sp. AA22]|nr:hypothetical protein [Mesorhizobium sp. AA22]